MNINEFLQIFRKALICFVKYDKIYYVYLYKSHSVKKYTVHEEV